MRESILQSSKECYITGRTDNLHRHHIYFGNPLRDVSEKNGFWVWLTGQYHNQDSRVDVHHNRALDLRLKQECQTAFEKTHSREEFMRLIGRSYL